MGRHLSPQAQHFREKYLRARYGRWWWYFYYRLPTRLPWTLVVLLSGILGWMALKSL